MRIKGVQMLALAFALGLGYPLQYASAQTVTATAKEKGERAATYRGIVLDQEGEPLPGVTVTIEGVKGRGVATDGDGNFTIGAKGPKAVLKFTYVGMKPTTAKGEAGKRMTVVMESDGHTLQETVVNGIYTRNIESFTGSVATFNSEQLKTIAPQGIIKSLALLDPSVILTEDVNLGSNPNALADITINGKMNVKALQQEYETDPNQPLFILDGFETTLRVISDLNMDRIESISILKDASATAIYGSKAANGVIVVETKKPKAGKLRVSYNGSLQAAWADLSDYNLMNSEQKLQFELLAGNFNRLNSDGSYVTVGEDGLPLDEIKRAEYMDLLRQVQMGYNTYWMNEPLRNAFTSNQNIFIEGGDQAFRYGGSLSYGKTEGVMKKSDRDVLTGNINLIYRVDDFSFTNQTNISNTDANNETVPFSRFSEMNPFYAKRAENGQVPKYVYQSEGDQTVWNPLWDFYQNSYNKQNTLSITNNFQFEWRVSRTLRVRGNMQYTTSTGRSEAFTSPNETSQVNLDILKRGSYNNTSNTSSRLSGRINATYGANWGRNTLNAVGGAQINHNENQSWGFRTIGYLSDKFSNPNFSMGYPEGSKPTSRDSKSRSVSYYSNLNYAYAMRYLLDFNLSSNGASQFGIDNPFTTTWSVGAGWNIYNESWFPSDNKYVQYLKINASYGNPGNQNYDAKLASSIYTYSTGYSNPFGTAAMVSQWGNSGLQWQKTKTFNIGLSAALIDRRLTFNVNYQTRKTEPQLVRIELPSSTGTTTAPMNVGGTDNKSFSVNGTYYILRNNDLNWYVSANLNNNITKYSGIGNSLEQYNQAGRASQTLVRMYDGASTTGLYAVRSKGIDPATGNEVYIRKDGTYTYEWNTDDEVLVGDSNPDLTGSLSTSLVYKGFSFATSFSYRTGGEVFLSTLLDKVENISSTRLKYNQDARALTDRWKRPGDIAKYKRIDDTSTTHKTTRFIATENTLQCASISLGYRMNSEKFLRAMGVSSVDIRAYMNDIFRISNIKEERGLSYPFQRSCALSLGFSF